MPISTYIAGATQRSLRNADADHPAALMAESARTALDDAGIAVASVDAIAAVESLALTYDDLTAEVAGALGCSPDVQKLWVPAGGTSPLDLLHLIGNQIDAGGIQCAVITGAEPMRTRRQARKEERDLPWPPRAQGVSPMRGQKPFSSELEQQHGLRMPIQLFPLLENAIRHAKGRTAAEQIEVAAQVLAKNAAVAAENPHAWFRDAPNAHDIADPSPDNRMIVYPYTKRMNAIMDVDQTAAIVLVSARFMNEHGLRGHCAAVLGGSGAEDAWNPVERETFSESPAMNHAVRTALQRAGINADQLTAMDLYSCFPSAVQFGLTAAGTDHHDPRPVTLTGGLAFAGGPGNAYVLHSLASALTRLRSQPRDKLMVTGIGMANTKHAATVLSHAEHIPAGASGAMTCRDPIEPVSRPVTEQGDGSARLVTYTIEYGRQGEPAEVIYLLDLDGGTRTIAVAADPAQACDSLMLRDPIGRAGTVSFDLETQRNLFELT